jgi:predicted nucleotidyltransferase
MWIENRKEPPPMEFEKLLPHITDRALLERISELLKKKKSGTELGTGPKIKELNTFIENMLRHFEHTVRSFDPKKKPKQEILEEGFIRILENIETGGA